MEQKFIKKEITRERQKNLEILMKAFPTAFQEGKFNVEAFKNELGEFETVSEEQYEFNWMGKQAAKQEAASGISGVTLKYIPQDSEDAQTTKNLYIQGDNLKVLKLLRNNYDNQIRMIYIDPPYNTGNDEFLYDDNFSISDKQSQEELGFTQEGEKVVNIAKDIMKKNMKNANKYHSRWLSMMYPRLKIAQELLAEEGVIFISIDDNEEENLKKMCDEIFGEENFINIIAVKTKASSGASGGGEDKRLKKNTEFILIYCKNRDEMILEKPVNFKEITKVIQEHEDNDVGFYYTRIVEDFGEKKLIQEVDDMKIYEHSHFQFSNVSEKMKKEHLTLQQVYNKYFDKIFMVTNAQTSLLEKVNAYTQGSQKLISYEYIPKSGKDKEKVTTKYIWNKTLMVWLHDSAIKNKEGVFKQEQLGTLWDDISYGRLDLQGDVSFKNGKKPLKLINRLVEMATDDDSIVLDFFSGSATTAHSVMEVNAKTNGHRKYIMVQIEEELKKDSEFSNTCELGKERIRRSAQKLKAETNADIDYGFKVFQLDETNINWEKQEYKANVDEYISKNGFIDGKQEEKLMQDFVQGANDIDIVYEILLRYYGMPLSAPIEKLSEVGERTYSINGTVIVCLEDQITEAFMDQLAKIKFDKLYLRDSSFQEENSLELKQNLMTR